MPSAPPPGTHHLVCLHHAGGSPALYRPWWDVANRLGVPLITPALPGRAGRAGEILLEDPEAAVAAMLSTILAAVDGPYHLFGHSLGGQLAYHVGRHALAIGAPPPVTLQVSAARARPSTTLHPDGLTDDGLLELVRSLGSVPDVALASDAWRRVAFPVLRSDLRLSSRLTELEISPLPLPVTVHGGTDDPLVPVEELAVWLQTSPQARLEMHPGGHFYLESAPLATAARMLRPVIAAGA